MRTSYKICLAIGIPVFLSSVQYFLFYGTPWDHLTYTVGVSVCFIIGWEIGKL